MKPKQNARQTAADKKFEQAAQLSDRARTNGASVWRERAAKRITEGNALVRGAVSGKGKK